MAYSRLTDPKNRKCVIGGGIAIVAVLIVIIVVAVTVTTTEELLDVENRTVLIVGSNNLADNIYKLLKNDITSFNFNANLRDDSVWGKDACSSCHTDLARLKEGQVTTQVLLANADCTAQYRDGSTLVLEQIDVINRLIQKYPNELELVLTAQDIKDDGKIGILIAAGGGYAIDSRIGLLRILYELGVRYMSLTSGCNTPWISGHVQPNENITFTAFGEEVVYEMNRLGVIVDLSGSAREAANRVLGVTRAPVIFSKSGVQAVSNHSKNVYDDTLELLKTNGGLIMVNFDDENIAYDEEFTLDHVIEHIQYIVNKIGYDHIGIGGNFDTTNNLPTDLDDISGLPSLFQKLKDKGWSEDNLNKLAAENFLRVFQEVENVKESLATADVCQTWINTTDFALTGVNSQVWQCRTRT